MKKQDQIISKQPTKLTEEDLKYVQQIVVKYLKSHEFVTNRILRGVVSITYDQAIFFFAQMLKRKGLNKVGNAGSTRYILPAKAFRGEL
jgi:predicted HTH transcriptional regulator